jgi:hypothetical protein
VRINDIQRCAQTLVVRAYEGTRVFSAVEARRASATRAYSPAEVCAAEGLKQGSAGWRASALSELVSLSVVSAQAGASVAGVAAHESAKAGSVFGPKRVASLAGVGLEVRRPIVVTDESSLERPAAQRPGTAPVASGRGGLRMQDQQEQFGTTGVGTDGYAFGSAANGTSPIDPWDHRTSSPPG